MKKFFLASVLFISAFTLQAQDEDKSKRPSPPAFARTTLAGGTVVRIDYSQPSLKGRTMGKDVEPMKGKIWRAGANEATVFLVDKPVTIEGKPLPAGKYALFMIDNGDTWTIIFNKTWDQMGAYEHKESEDVLRVKVKPAKSPYKVERLTYTISKGGKTSLMWGDTEVSFQVQ